MGLTDQIQQIIKSNPVVVFSKSYCPYCRSTKELFKKLNVETKVIELDEEDEGPEMQDELYNLTKQKTVPNIFIGQNHVGGNSDLQAKYKDGQVKTLLAQAGIKID